MDRLLRKIVLGALTLSVVATTLSMTRPVVANTSIQARTTTVVVLSTIVLTGIPDTIQYPIGNPSSGVAAPDFTANVVTNNRAGYTIDVVTSNVSSAGTNDTIPAISWTGVSLVCHGVTSCTGGSASSGVIATSTRRTSESGDTWTISSSIAIPFIDSGIYRGTAVFTAKSL